MSDGRAFLDRLDDFDETSDAGAAACKAIVADGINYYSKPILRCVNAAPPVDRPLTVAALRLLFEGILATDSDMREAVDAILNLPLRTITTRGGDGHGV